MSKQILNEEFKKMQKLAGLITENQLNENMRLFDLKDENNESTELYKINNFTTVEDVINKLNQHLGIEVEDESDSLYTDDSGTGYKYVHVAGDGNCHFVKSLGEFDDGYQTEEEWGVSTEEPLKEADDDGYYDTSDNIDNIISQELKDNFIKSVETIKSAVARAGNEDIDEGDVYDYLIIIMTEKSN